MANAGLSWSALRPLRPVLLAGAAAMAWLAFSAPAADADNPHDRPSLLGGISSTATSVGNGVSKAVGSAAGGASAAHAPDHSAAAPQPEPVPLPQPSTVASEPVSAAPVSEPVAAPVTAAPDGVLAPVVAVITVPVDAVLGELPVADILPPAPVADLTDPVVALADTAVPDIAETDVQPVTDTLPVDVPVEPISDLVTGTPPLITPVATPIPGVLDVVDDLVARADQAPAPPAAGNAPVAGPGRTDVGTGSPAASLLAATGASGAPPTHPAGSDSSGYGESPGSSPALPAGGGSPSGGETQSPAALLPASPSGSGSGQSSGGGPAASAAWLSSPFEYLPLTGIVPVSGPLQHTPSPVAIDPGSSPD